MMAPVSPWRGLQTLNSGNLNAIRKCHVQARGFAVESLLCNELGDCQLEATLSKSGNTATLSHVGFIVEDEL
jgi:hypothetical protein